MRIQEPSIKHYSDGFKFESRKVSKIKNRKQKDKKTMTVKELSRDQLSDLKQMYYENDNDESQLYYDKYESIPDYVIYEYYDGLEFNDDDIWRVFE